MLGTVQHKCHCVYSVLDLKVERGDLPVSATARLPVSMLGPRRSSLQQQSSGHQTL